MDQSVNKESEKTSNYQDVVSKAFRLATFPVALVSGALTGYINVRSSTIEKMKKFSELRTLNEGFISQFEKVFTRQASKTITPEESAKLSREIIEIKAAQSEATNKLITSKLGSGLTGFKNKYFFIDKGNRHKALVEGLTVAGIAVGVMLTIANTRSLGEFFMGESKDADKER